MFKSLLTNLGRICYRVRNGIRLSNAKYESVVTQVNAIADDLQQLTDTELQTRFTRLRNVLRPEPRLQDSAIEALAVIREAADRALQMRPYDVQMLAAVAMHDHSCVEMQTGEGKTLAAAVLACLRVAYGQSVHVLTFNDYLAQRDAEWMGPLYRFLGLSAGAIAQTTTAADRRQAYACDVTYVTGKEAGFDFLRDQTALQLQDRVHRHQAFAIVDEADSLLIDEARIPLVIATADERDDTDLYAIANLVETLQPEQHYSVKASGRNVSLTEAGLAMMERQLGIDELHDEQHMQLLARINLALQARVLLTRDVDYIVRDGQLQLIDEFTGRVAADRKWPGGLQASLEAREKLAVQPQGRILNTITLQQYIALYEGLAGMTGTATEAADELTEFYNLNVVVVPPHKPCVRVDHPDRIFRSKREKHLALVEDILQQHANGRPLLIGTSSVDESETLAVLLREAGISCRVLNAANDQREAEIIADAGALGAVTISTNMAGRGTDICLGGALRQDHGSVVAAGGLYVIGTNRHESRRIDNQLRGRSGRQGDPGESRFFVSLEDDLIARHGVADLVASTDNTVVDSNAAVESALAARVAHVQRVIEGESFEIRRTLRKYAFLLEVQRRSVSKDRDELLSGTRPPGILQKREPELREELVARWGEALVNATEVRVTLLLLDRLWSEHLTHAAEIRDSVHLSSYGGFNPQDIFNRDMNREFGQFVLRVEEAVVQTFQTNEFTADGIDLDHAGLQGPSSTWTFMVNDNPRGAVLNLIMKGVLRRLKNAVSTP
jgi:preprotein translocase subunit SecA